MSNWQTDLLQGEKFRMIFEGHEYSSRKSV